MPMDSHLVTTTSRANGAPNVMAAAAITTPTSGQAARCARVSGMFPQTKSPRGEQGPCAAERLARTLDVFCLARASVPVQRHSRNGAGQPPDSCTGAPYKDDAPSGLEPCSDPTVGIVAGTCAVLHTWSSNHPISTYRSRRATACQRAEFGSLCPSTSEFWPVWGQRSWGSSTGRAVASRRPCGFESRPRHLSAARGVRPTRRSLPTQSKNLI